jgi:transposase
MLSDDAGQMPDTKYLHQELRRPGVTLERLWQEYWEREPNGCRRSRFYYHYRRQEERSSLYTMRAKSPISSTLRPKRSRR